jgi:hypothetical protein
LLTTEEHLLVFPLKESSEEYKEVKKSFVSTLPDALIEKIERIQNKRLWKIYQTELDNV